MQRKKKTDIFQLRTPPSWAWHTPSAPERFAEFKKSFCQQRAQKWNDNKKSDRKNEKVDHTESAGENLAAGSAETEITVTMFYRLPTYSVPIKRTPFSDINNPKQ